jgi:hypothetical protein
MLLPMARSWSAIPLLEALQENTFCSPRPIDGNVGTRRPGCKAQPKLPVSPRRLGSVLGEGSIAPSASGQQNRLGGPSRDLRLGSSPDVF